MALPERAAEEGNLILLVAAAALGFPTELRSSMYLRLREAPSQDTRMMNYVVTGSLARPYTPPLPKIAESRLENCSVIKNTYCFSR